MAVRFFLFSVERCSQVDVLQNQNINKCVKITALETENKLKPMGFIVSYRAKHYFRGL